MGCQLILDQNASVLQTASAINFHTQCRGVKLRASKPHSNRRPAIAVIGVTITVGAMLDRRSLSYAALGLGPSWMLLDGVSPPVFFFLMIVMV